MQIASAAGASWMSDQFVFGMFASVSLAIIVEKLDDEEVGMMVGVEVREPAIATVPGIVSSG